MVRVALVTGSSSGLGLALSVALAREGYATVATMRDPARGDALRAAAAEAGVELDVRALDVTDTDSVAACTAGAIADHGRLDVLVNNAGAGFVRTTEQATEADIRANLDVNLMGVIRCTKAVIGHMRERRSGHVINVTSVGGLVGQPFNEIYCAAKFAVEGYTEALASYVQPHFGVRFTAVEPGGISSAFAASALAHFQASGGMIDDEYRPLLERYIGGAEARRTSAERSGTPIFQTPEEVAAVVLACLAADEPPVRVRTSDWAETLCETKTGLDPDGRKLQAKVAREFLGEG